MNTLEIANGIYYVGVNDRTLGKFEGLWSLPYGVSYNSYIVKGEKTALIDTVEISHCTKILEQIDEILGGKPLDYLVINHIEPDHSGSIAIIKEHYPNVNIVGNAKTLAMLNGFYSINTGLTEIKENDVIDLGGSKKLSFIITPMVHWPETMMTFEESSSTLFSGDAFGCFGALNGGVVDTDLVPEMYFNEMYRYYSAIVAKYGVFVQKALAKVSGIDIKTICSTHGPVWKKYIKEVVSIYDRLSKYEPEDGVVIAYGSMYGNTERVAESIARCLSHKGLMNIKIYNVSYADMSEIISSIVRYKGFVIGCPTYSNGIFPPMQALIDAIKLREVKNKVCGCFGSFSWAPGISKKINALLNEMSVETVEANIEVKQSVSPQNELQIEQFCDRFFQQYCD